MAVTGGVATNGRERGCVRRNHMFRRLLKASVVAKDELGACEIEFAEGVVISTRSATHLLGSPLSRVSPIILAPFHILPTPLKYSPHPSMRGGP